MNEYMSFLPFVAIILFVFVAGLVMLIKAIRHRAGWTYPIVLLIFGGVASFILWSIFIGVEEDKAEAQAYKALLTSGRKIVIPASVAFVEERESSRSSSGYRYDVGILTTDPDTGDSLALFFLYSHYVLINNGERSIATVKAYNRRSSDNGVAFAPVVEFKTSSDKVVMTELPDASNPPEYKIGEQTTVYYAPDNHNNITTLSYRFIIAEAVFMGIGIILMMAGVYFFLL
ncbi:MAG: DUF3592 domain-containing protein [Bacteroidota bacterium]